MNYLEHKYISLISSHLQNFSKKSGNLYNCRCIFCGDSKTNPRKARGYIYEKDGHVAYFCQKCKISKSFKKFLQEIDSFVYEEYIKELYLEKFGDRKKEVENKTDFKAPVFTNILKSLKSIDELSKNDEYRLYVEKRKIPEKHYSLLFKCEKFKEFTNNLIPGKLDKGYEESRLLIPFFSLDKKLFGYSGRSLIKNSELRYINIILHENEPKLYGMERIKLKEKIKIVEGPIDSLFLENCLASCGGDMVSSLSGILNKVDKEQITIIYDNEKRSEFTREKIKRAINSGYKVCIFPSYIEEKDINEMILRGISSYEIEEIIQKNTYQGLNAHAKLSMIR